MTKWARPPVYSLGGTLYTILTNQAPTHGASHREMVEKEDGTTNYVVARDLNPFPQTVRAVCRDDELPVILLQTATPPKVDVLVPKE